MAYRASRRPSIANYLPGRNLLLLSKVVVLCALHGVERVAMAPLSSNPFPDGTPEFFRAFPNAASAQKPQYPVRVNRASS